MPALSAFPMAKIFTRKILGTNCPKTRMTSFDSLGVLIKKFNAKAPAKNPTWGIDPGLVDLRDALAHGRVSAPIISDFLQLVKFSPPKAGKVTMTFKSQMDKGWFQAQTDRVHRAILIAHAAYES